jgi:glycosyltransferase involved in cell wall biosynthesis
VNTPSVLLPVYNAQGHLEALVGEVLEVLSELVGRFELAILDDGSTDDTAHVVHDLAARYPQIRVIRHPVRLGLAEAIQTGLDNTQGEIILVGDEDYCLDPDDLGTLWRLRDAQWRMKDRHDLAEAVRPEWVERLLGWRPRAAGPRRAFQVIRRHVFEQFRMRQAAEMMHRLDAPQSTAGTALARRLGNPKFLKTAGRFTSDN